MAGLAGHALGSGGPAAAFTAFLAAALVMVLLFFGLAAAIALAQERLVQTLKTSAPQVKKWGGRILIAVGLWLIALSLWADFFAGIFTV